MTLLTLADLENRSTDVEAAVDATGGIDRWCSGLDWVLPVAAGFAPDVTPLVLAAEGGFALCASYLSAGDNKVIAGLEPLWGFSFPIIGPNPTGVARSFVAHIAERDDWDFVVLPGAPGPNHPLTITVATEMARLGTVHLQEGITRQIADIGDGYDAWFSRRSPKFRRNLRRTVRAADEADLTLSLEDAAQDDALFERILAIDHRSWKGQDGSGITSTEMSTMYATMIDRLHSRSRLHAHIARRQHGDDWIDVGYILGGLRNRQYRGLQLSYVSDIPEVANASIGNLLQHHQLKLLSEGNLADRYDMGMDFDYKRRWADRAETSSTIVMTRHT